MKYKVKEDRFGSEAECNNRETAVDIVEIFLRKYAYKTGDACFKITLECELEKEGVK